jgi:threonine synthase
MASLKYVSTRGARLGSFAEVTLQGLAPDGGLALPETYPVLDLDAFYGKSYVEIAASILKIFGPEISDFEWLSLCQKAYTAETFGSPEITPLKWLESGRLGMLKLSEGPTLAFKDVPLQLLGRLNERFLRESNRVLNILGATSGDTGSAAAYAVIGKKRQKLFMLTPKGRMSAFQRKQMSTLREPNIFIIEIDSTFDDCQAIVKAVSSNAEFKNRFSIGAVNSINWARIAAQVVYYVYGYLQTTGGSRKRVTIVVPSGNFGNACAAYIAQQMGLPIDIVVATNENDVLDVFFKTGIYRVRTKEEVMHTTSPSMDIAASSNLERPIFDACDRDGELVRDLYSDLATTGQFDGRFMSPWFATRFRSGSATMSDVERTIRYLYNKYDKLVVDPHTAVAFNVGLENWNGVKPMIVVETAQPAKFAGTIMDTLGIKVPVPKGYENLMSLQEHVYPLEANANAVMQFIAEHARS